MLSSSRQTEVEEAAPEVTLTPESATTATTADFVHVSGVRIRVSRQGTGGTRPLLLINGIGAPLELWAPLRAALGIETIAFDAPGTGLSDSPTRPRSMWELATMVAALLDKLHCGDVDVLGYSWGGGLAQHLAAVRGAAVGRLILACTGWGFGSIPRDPSALLHLMTPARYLSRGYLKRVGPNLYGGETRRQPSALAEQGRVRSTRPPTLRGYVNQLLAAGSWAMLPTLPLISHETLILAGGEDPIMHTANAHIMARLIPHSTLHVFPQAGHLLLFDEAEAAAAVIKPFLAGDGTTEGRTGTDAAAEPGGAQVGRPLREDSVLARAPSDGIGDRN